MSGRAFGGRHLDRQRARANVAEGRWPACPRQAQVRGDDKQLSWLSRRAEPSRTQVDRRGAKAGLGCRHRRCADGGRMARSRDCRRHVRPSNGRFRDARADAPAIGDRRIADGQVQSTALEWPDLSIAAVDTPAATAGTTPRPSACDGRDNAATETLFGSSKVERLHEMRFATRRRAKPFDSSPRSLTRIASLGSGDRLAFVLPSPEAARDAGIARPDRLPEKTACR
jgi:hypothetical protein